MEKQIILALGANVGDRRGNLREGLSRLAPLVRVSAVSSLYETPPSGVTEQPPFYNAVCAALTELDPEALLRYLKGIERALGRRPGPMWGPRPLDLDILSYADSMFATTELQIPHPRLAERAFVLVPLAELAPELAPAGLGQSVAELLQRVDQQGIRLIAAPGWESREDSRE